MIRDVKSSENGNIEDKPCHQTTFLQLNSGHGLTQRSSEMLKVAFYLSTPLFWRFTVVRSKIGAETRLEGGPHHSLAVQLHIDLKPALRVWMAVIKFMIGWNIP